MRFAQNLSYYRKQNQMSQERLAELCNVSRQSVAKWEKGISEPDLYTIFVIARHFNITIDELAMGEINEAQSERQKLLMLLKDKTSDFSEPESIEAIESELCGKALVDIVVRLDSEDSQDRDKLDYLNEFLRKTSEDEDEPFCLSLYRRLVVSISKCFEEPGKIWTDVKYILGIIEIEN